VFDASLNLTGKAEEYIQSEVWWTLANLIAKADSKQVKFLLGLQNSE
jgi:hypothetical protein